MNKHILLNFLRSPELAPVVFMGLGFPPNSKLQPLRLMKSVGPNMRSWKGGKAAGMGLVNSEERAQCPRISAAFQDVIGLQAVNVTGVDDSN